MRRRLPTVAVLLVLAACGDPPTAAPPEPEPEQPAPPNPIPSARATVHGQVLTITGKQPAGLWVRGWTGIDSVTAPVMPDGMFSLKVPKGALDSTVLVIGQDFSHLDEFQPALRVFSRVDQDMDLLVALLPRTWTIEAGAHAGQTVPVSLQPALAPENVSGPSGGDGQFFLVSGWPERHASQVKPALWTGSWSHDEYPLPVYFKAAGPDYDGRTVTPTADRDTATFWSVVRGMERTFGRDLFAPADSSTLDARTIEDDRPIRMKGIAVRVTDPPAGFAGAYLSCPVRELPPPFPPHPFCDDLGPGQFAFAEVTVPDLVSPYVIQHELMHAMGFGHGCWHPTMMGGCAGPYPSQYLGRENEPSYHFVPTPFDVAYIELYWAVHRMTVEHRPDLGLVEALDGERRLILDLGPIPPDWRDAISGDNWVVP